MFWTRLKDGKETQSISVSLCYLFLFDKLFLQYQLLHTTPNLEFMFIFCNRVMCEIVEKNKLKKNPRYLHMKPSETQKRKKERMPNTSFRRECVTHLVVSTAPANYLSMPVQVGSESAGNAEE